MASDLRNQILVGREGFAFFVDIEYERLPAFSSSYWIIGHSLADCRKSNKKHHLVKDIRALNSKKLVAKYVPKTAISKEPQEKVVDTMQQVLDQENSMRMNKGKEIMIDNNPQVDSVQLIGETSNLPV